MGDLRRDKVRWIEGRCQNEVSFEENMNWRNEDGGVSDT